MKTIPIITIDGPGGTGKGTVSALLAKDLKWHYLDSGCLYRALAWIAKEHGIALDEEVRLAVLAKEMDVVFQDSGKVFYRATVGRELQEITQAIRTEDCGTQASKISALSLVRQALLEKQRAYGRAPGLVTDGRDMGTVIFPEAAFKFFLWAAPEERAKRRYKQLKEQGMEADLQTLCNELMMRDKRDQERAVAPLKPAQDAVVIDTTFLTVSQVFIEIKKYL